jgi:hypothetical protein
MTTATIQTISLLTVTTVSLLSSAFLIAIQMCPELILDLLLGPSLIYISPDPPTENSFVKLWHAGKEELPFPQPGKWSTTSDLRKHFGHMNMRIPADLKAGQCVLSYTSHPLYNPVQNHTLRQTSERSLICVLLAISSAPNSSPYTKLTLPTSPTPAAAPNSTPTAYKSKSSATAPSPFPQASVSPERIVTRIRA